MEHRDKSVAIESIHIQSIPHDSQRYNTVGDYMENSPGHWVILVSDTGNWRMNMLVAFHELAELIQTHGDDVSESDITAFDESFEKEHQQDESEPGNDIKAPYHQQHVFSECVERLLAQRLGIEWEQYEKIITDIWRPKTKTK